MKRLTTLLLLALIATTLVAQRRSRNSDALPNTPYDGKFTFVRIKYNPGGMGGDGGFGYGDPRWNHDYPRAEAHFGKILSELSLVNLAEAWLRLARGEEVTPPRWRDTQVSWTTTTEASRTAGWRL